MSALLKMVQDKLIPWCTNNLHQRVIVARPEMTAASVPDDVILEPYPIKGERIIFKAERQYANTRVQIAEWPEAGLLETNNLRLACVMTGRAVYQIHGYRLHAGSGHLIVLPPGTPHPAGSHPHLKDNSGYCELLNLQLYRSAVQCWTCISDNKTHHLPHSENFLLRNEKLVRLFQIMMEENIESQARSERAQQLREYLTASFFMMLLRELEAGHFSRPGATAAQETTLRGSGDFATLLYEYIQTHLNDSLTLEDAARHMHLSRTQFSRQIKQETGKTFVEVLTDCRISTAKTLLTESDWTSAAVAEFIGFKSATYFNALFLEKTGQTPGKYRHTSRSEANQNLRTKE